MEIGNTSNKHASGASKSAKKPYHYADIQYVKCFPTKKLFSINTLRQSVTHSGGKNQVNCKDDISVYIVCEQSGRISVVALVGFMVSHGIIPECNRD